MFQPIRQTLLLSPVVIGTALMLSSVTAAICWQQRFAFAQTTLNSSSPNQLSPYSQEDFQPTMAQVTSVSQFRDVSPQVWYFDALKNLVDNYGCIEGYSDQTYRGNNNLSRGEFAAGMNSCLGKLERRMIGEMEAIKTQSTTNTTDSSGKSTGMSLQESFNRAFGNDTGRFYEITNLSGQFNQILGWRNFPGSFFDNQISNDGKTVETVYYDAMRQQTAGPRLISRDMPNPFDTSISENPSYTRTAPPPNNNSGFGIPQQPSFP